MTYNYPLSCKHMHLSFKSVCNKEHKGVICNLGARQFVKNHLADTTIGRIRLLVDATFRRVRHLVEKNSQVRHSVEVVKSLFSTKRRTRRNVASTKCH